MQRFESRDALLRGLRKIVVGEMHVDELRVAAIAGKRDGVQRRRLRRTRMVGVVGVKRSARDSVLARRDLGLSDFVDVGMAYPHFLVMMLHERAEDLARGRELC